MKVKFERPTTSKALSVSTNKRISRRREFKIVPKPIKAKSLTPKEFEDRVLNRIMDYERKRKSKIERLKEAQKKKFQDMIRKKPKKGRNRKRNGRLGSCESNYSHCSLCSDKALKPSRSLKRRLMAKKEATRETPGVIRRNNSFNLDKGRHWKPKLMNRLSKVIAKDYCSPYSIKNNITVTDVVRQNDGSVNFENKRKNVKDRKRGNGKGDLQDLSDFFEDKGGFDEREMKLIKDRSRRRYSVVVVEREGAPGDEIRIENEFFTPPTTETKASKTPAAPRKISRSQKSTEEEIRKIEGKRLVFSPKEKKSFRRMKESQRIGLSDTELDKSSQGQSRVGTKNNIEVLELDDVSKKVKSDSKKKRKKSKCSKIIKFKKYTQNKQAQDNMKTEEGDSKGAKEEEDYAQCVIETEEETIEETIEGLDYRDLLEEEEDDDTVIYKQEPAPSQITKKDPGSLKSLIGDYIEQHQDINSDTFVPPKYESNGPHTFKKKPPARPKPPLPPKSRRDKSNNEGGNITEEIDYSLFCEIKRRFEETLNKLKLKTEDSDEDDDQILFKVEPGKNKNISEFENKLKNVLNKKSLKFSEDFQASGNGEVYFNEENEDRLGDSSYNSSNSDPDAYKVDERSPVSDQRSSYTPRKSKLVSEREEKVSSSIEKTVKKTHKNANLILRYKPNIAQEDQSDTSGDYSYTPTTTKTKKKSKLGRERLKRRLKARASKQKAEEVLGKSYKEYKKEYIQKLDYLAKKLNMDTSYYKRKKTEEKQRGFNPVIHKTFKNQKEFEDRNKKLEKMISRYRRSFQPAKKSKKITRFRSYVDDVEYVLHQLKKIEEENE